MSPTASAALNTQNLLALAMTLYAESHAGQPATRFADLPELTQRLWIAKAMRQTDENDIVHHEDGDE